MQMDVLPRSGDFAEAQGVRARGWNHLSVERSLTRDRGDGDDCPLIVIPRRRRVGWLLVLVAVGAAGIATAVRADGSKRSWAPIPEEVLMPAAAPDDPMAYRGVRFRRVGLYDRGSVDSGGQVVPWLSASSSDMRGMDVGVHFGDYLVLDGRRRMKWFVRQVDPPWRPIETNPGPVVAVLDVLVLPDEPAEPRRNRWQDTWRRACGPDGDEAIIIGDDSWRLNRSTGRFEPTAPDYACLGE